MRDVMSRVGELLEFVSMTNAYLEDCTRLVVFNQDSMRLQECVEIIDGWTEQKNIEMKRNRTLDNLHEAQLRAQLSLYLDMARLVETFIGRKAQCAVDKHINLSVGQEVAGLKQPWKGTDRLLARLTVPPTSDVIFPSKVCKARNFFS